MAAHTGTKRNGAPPDVRATEIMAAAGARE
jgi:hypothetical protein